MDTCVIKPPWLFENSTDSNEQAGDGRIIMAIIDWGSKFAWLEVVPDKTAKSAASVFTNALKTMPRPPSEIKTDNGLK